MGHYVRGAAYSPQTAAKTADFRLRLLEAPAYTAEPIKKNGFTSKLASALFLLTPVHNFFTT